MTCSRQDDRNLYTCLLRGLFVRSPFVNVAVCSAALSGILMTSCSGHVQPGTGKREIKSTGLLLSGLKFTTNVHWGNL